MLFCVPICVGMFPHNPTDKALKGFQTFCLFKILTQCLANRLVSETKTEWKKVVLSPTQEYSSGPKFRALDFNLAVLFVWSGGAIY